MRPAQDQDEKPYFADTFRAVGSGSTFRAVDSERLVGRNDALEILGDMTAALAAGVGGVVLVEGEQGIGKTELLRVSLAGESRYRLLWGAADELGQSVPLTLMGQCLAGVDAGPPGQGPDVGRAAGVFAGDPVLAAVEGILAAVDRLCASSPVVLVAEDLQWADEASVLAWYRLSRAVSQLPLLVAGSFRPGSDREDLARLRRSLTARGGRVIELGPLAQPEMDVLVESLVGGRPGERLASLLGWAGGNPLYARELADGLVWDGRIQVEGQTAELIGESGLARVPKSASAAIAERLAHLAEDAVTVLRWAAVLGSEFSVADLAVVTSRPAGDLVDIIGSAQAAGVVADAGHRLAFRHGLIRQVLYEQMPVALRIGLHRQAAQALAAVGTAPERVAAQLIAARAPGAEQAGPEHGGAIEPGMDRDGTAASPAGAAQPWVLEWLTHNSHVLLHRAPQVAADLLRSVLAQLAADDSRRGQFEASMLTALFLLGQDAAVEQAGRRLLAKAGNPDLSWLVAYSMVRVGRAVEAVAVLSEARAQPALSPAQAARLSALNGHILTVLGRIDQAVEAARAALAGPGDPLAQGYAHYVLSSVSYMRRDGHVRLGHIDQGLAALGNDPQFTDLRLLTLANRTNVLSDLGRTDEALAAGQEAVVLGERAGAPRAAWARTMLAITYYTSGLWDDALTEMEPAVGRENSGYIGIYAHSLAALIAGHRGDQEDAAEHLSVVPDTAGWVKQAGPQSLHGPILARAVTAEQRSGPDEAIAVLAQCLEPGLAELMPTRHVLLPDLTRLALEVGDTGLARAAADAAAQEARREPLGWKQSAADHCRGLVQGDAQAVLAAADYARAAGRSFDYSQALENAAVMAAAGGDEAAARKLAADAVRQYVRLGARWDIRRADTRLRAHGVRQAHRTHRERPAAGWAALTPTEVKVARLAAQGLSNPDIAARLFLSRNTVQTHVSHILAKLGARSRAEIVHLAAAHPPSATAR
jgi:DNA-binding CsgD family transcriptional regulator/tetratricopeptide (TPR) repeat protein